MDIAHIRLRLLELGAASPVSIEHLPWGWVIKTIHNDRFIVDDEVIQVLKNTRWCIISQDA